MKKHLFHIWLLMSTFLAYTILSFAQIVSPEKYFGYQPGSDRNLFTYEELIAYLDLLDKASPKIKLVENGKSPMGRTMYIAFISSEENIGRIDELKTYNRKLALDPALTQQEKEKIIQDGKVFILGTLSMHSSEVAPAQALPLIAYDLITTTDPAKSEWLRNVVYMAVPNHNPDGMDMIVEHYKKYKGTKYEGSSLPAVYHKYVGHDNNRDFLTLTQEDTRAIARIYSLDWFPQVMVEKHQMGSTGPRYYVPPSHDPIAENVDEGIWNWVGIFGANMMKDLTHDGLAGVSQHTIFDDYWPGSTETCIWQNVIGMLTEGASAKLATPIYIEPTELQVSGKGLSEYKKGINMPLLWEGGWWRLSDLIKYEISSTLSILKTASENRQDILHFRNDMCIKETEKGENLPPYYYVFRKNQHDRSELVNLVNLMKLHGIKVYALTKDVTVNHIIYPEGSIVIPLAQPFRAFIKEVLEKQIFPVRHYTPDGEIIKPYDIASWSLPLHFGVHASEINIRSSEIETSIREIENTFNLVKESPVNFSAIIFPVENNESYLAAFKALAAEIGVERLIASARVNGQTCNKGSFLIKVTGKNHDKLNKILSELSVSPVYLDILPELKTEKLVMPQIALVETNFHDMDAGWTRYIFDQYAIPFKILKPGDFASAKLHETFDILIFPDVPKSVLMEGKYGNKDDYYPVDYPPEFKKGMGKEGMKNLMSFIDGGGLVISWGESVGLFEKELNMPHEKDTEDFRLPFNNISESLIKKGLYCPGSLIRMKVTQDHPVTLGMEEEMGIFFRGEPVFTTEIPDLDMDRRVLGVIPERDILMSGYIEKEELLGNKPIMLWLKKGKGQFVLFGFGPQFRASTHVSYKLLFNSILLKSQRHD
jgi:hypothetical protein